MLLVLLLIVLIYLVDMNTKKFWSPLYFAQLRILNLFIKSSFNPFVDIVLTFFSRSSSLVLTSICLALFEVTFLLKVFSLSSKSVVFIKTAISFLLAKLACANLEANFSDVDVNSYDHDQ